MANNRDSYISLTRATQYCNYSQEYLALRARQGKLKAVKFGRNWVTKKEWMEEYLREVEEYNNQLKTKNFKEKTTGPKLSVKQPALALSNFVKQNLGRLLVALVFVLLTTGIVFALQTFGVEQQIKQISQKIVQGYAVANDFVEQKLGGFGKESFQYVFDPVRGFVVDATKLVSAGISNGIDATKKTLTLGIEGGKIIISDGAKEAKSFSDPVFSLVTKINTGIDKGIAEISQKSRLRQGFGNQAKTKSQKLVKDISSSTYIIVGAITDTLYDISKSLANISKDINGSISMAVENVNSVLAEIRKTPSQILKEYFSWLEKEISNLGEKTVKGYLVANDFVEKKMVEIWQGAKNFALNVKMGFEKVRRLPRAVAEEISNIGRFGKEFLKKGALTISTTVKNISQEIAEAGKKTGQALKLVSQKIVKSYLSANQFVEQKLSQIGWKIAQPFIKAYKFVIQPWRITLPEKIVIEEGVKKEELETLKEKIKELEGKLVKEIIKEVEVSRVTKVEPVKEITKEIKEVDSEAVKLFSSQISDLQTEMTKRLYAPGGVIAQQIYVKEPVQSPKIYQENGEIVLQTLGSGNVILSAATGLQLHGQQVVIDSNSILNPLVYIADETKIGGPITAQRITLNAPSNYTGKILEVQSGGASKFSINETGTATLVGNFTVVGDLSVTGSQTFSGAIALSASSTSPVLTVAQTGSGYGAIITGGYVGIATSTPSYPLHVWGSAGFGTSTTPLFYVNSGSQRVGFSTTTPSYDVSVQGNLYATAFYGDGSTLTGIVGGGQWTQTDSYLYPSTLTWAVGIATSSPRFDLDVWGNAGFGTTTDISVPLLYIDSGNGKVGIATSTPSYKLHVWGSAGFGTSTTPVLYVDSGTGNVGIGTASPDRLLRIKGDATALQFAVSNASDYGIAIGAQTSDTFGRVQGAQLGTGVAALALNPDGGNVGIATTTPRWKLDVWGDAGFGTTTDYNVPVLYVDSGNGKVGIATSTPSYKLHVWGSAGFGTSTTPVLYVDSGNSRVGIGTTTPATLFSVATSTDILNVTLGGSVGIGITSPTAKLSLQGTASSDKLLTLKTTSDAAEKVVWTADGGIEWRGVTTGSGSRLVKLTNTADVTFSGLALNSSDLAVFFSVDDSDQAILTVGSGTPPGNTRSGVWVQRDPTSNLNIIATHRRGSASLYDLAFGIMETFTFSEVFRIATTTGNVGIATTTPAWKLHVFGGGICVDAAGAGVCPSEVAGAIAVDTGPGESTATSVISFDIAERYPSTEILEPGDVVITDETNPGYVKKSSQGYQSNLIGVVSQKPALAMEGSILFLAPKEEATSTKPYIALVGRVKVKVSTENGPIQVGDPLTSASSTLGAAMKATKAGRIIGIALEAYNPNTTNSDPNAPNIGKVMVFINPHWLGNDLGVEQNGDGQIVNLSPEQLRMGLASLGLVVSENGALEVGTLKAKKVITEEFEIRDKATGEIYCTWIENGEWVKEKGECQNLNNELGESTIIEATSTETSPVEGIPTNPPPDTILDSYPDEITSSTEATFTFRCSKEGCQFTCQLDSEMWQGCTSPQQYFDLIQGNHQFKVQAISSANREDPIPATFEWKITFNSTTTEKTP